MVLLNCLFAPALPSSSVGFQLFKTRRSSSASPSFRLLVISHQCGYSSSRSRSLDCQECLPVRRSVCKGVSSDPPAICIDENPHIHTHRERRSPGRSRRRGRLRLSSSSSHLTLMGAASVALCAAVTSESLLTTRRYRCSRRRRRCSFVHSTGLRISFCRLKPLCCGISSLFCPTLVGYLIR